jgi:DNA-binding transcriptional MerR regulator
MKIHEVSKKYDITADTLRYYERIGLLPTVHRNQSGIRDYTEEDCKGIEFVKCMRSAGISIESLIEYMTLFQQGDETREARRSILVEERSKLLERMEQMKETLDRLNYKIDYYYKWDGTMKK